jgi:regulator of sirC expression with transglutaminase-like and TPR domain
MAISGSRHLVGSGLRGSVRWGALAVAFLVVLLYLPALGNGFVNWDDDIYVYANPQLRSIAPPSLLRAFTHIHPPSGNWHPLTMVSHAVDYAMWGLRPWGHHLTSILLHGCNAALVVLLAVRLLQARGCALSKQGMLAAGVVAGLLFGLHPLHVESVAWVSERKDLLAALFYLLGVLSYLRYAGHAAGAVGLWKDRRYLTTLLCFVLALLSKPMALSFPFVLLIIDWYPLDRLKDLRRILVEKIPFFILDLGLATVTVLAQRASGSFRPLAEVTMGSRVLVATKAAALYLAKTLLPTGLLPFYSYPTRVSLWSWEFGFPVVVMTAAILGCLVAVKKHRAFATALACYGVVLLPVLGIVQIGPQAMADRYTYLPSVALVALLGAGCGVLWDRHAVAAAWWKKACAVTAALLLLGLLSWQSVRQIGVWRNSETLWSRVVQYEPWNTEAYNNRASYYYDRGEYEKALADYDSALRVQPSLGQAHARKRRSAYFNDRAITYVRLGRYAEALADEGQAIELRPTQASYYFNRGNIHFLTGRYPEARDDLDRAIAASPVPVPAYFKKRGQIYRRLGMEDKALQDMERAQGLQSEPRTP